MVNSDKLARGRILLILQVSMGDLQIQPGKIWALECHSVSVSTICRFYFGVVCLPSGVLLEKDLCLVRLAVLNF